MSNVILLTKTLLKNNLIGGSSKGRKSKRDNAKYIYLAIVLVYGLVFSLPIIFLLKNVFAMHDFSELILSVALPTGAITAMIFGCFTITSVFYFNKDSEQLLPYPIKSSELLIAKFLSSLLSEYFMLFMFIYPIIFGVGVGLNASVIYYLYASIICLLMPIIPSVIVAVIMMFMNKIINIGKRKNLFMYAMIGLVLVFSLGYGLGLGQVLEMDQETLVNILLNGDATSIVNTFKYVFPFFNSATYSLLYCDEFVGFASFMTFIGFNVLFMVVLYYLGDLLYIKGLTKNNGNSKERKTASEEKYKSNGDSVMLSLIKKEWRKTNNSCY